ncbi:hypothetical protein GCM10009754_05790 [Amycolatopsis minnesotensis]|uniref:Uncharacterized protein n=1 Tax=Amycolatopsis minnesotensis TaxID=337894 RepID=A0ABN2Q1M1_9PSEU
MAPVSLPEVSFDRHPDSYRHWRLRLDGPIARLDLDVDPGGGIRLGYELKLSCTTPRSACGSRIPKCARW